MIVLDSDRILFCDVDDTLVDWKYKLGKKTTIIEVEGKSNYYSINQEVVDAIKEHKLRGHKVVVWSHGGYKWAKAVVKTLKIEEYVDLICSKPSWLYDDLMPSEWMPTPKFLRNKE